MIPITEDRSFVIAFTLLEVLWPLDEDWVRDDFPGTKIFVAAIDPFHGVALLSSWTNEDIFSFKKYINENPLKRDMFRMMARLCGLIEVRAMFAAIQGME